MENVHIGGNDRQGRFQFVPRIGDKLPLAFKSFLHGTHGSFGQDHGQQKYHALHQQEHQNADQQQYVASLTKLMTALLLPVIEKFLY